MNINLKKIDIEKILFFDIETVRKNEQLEPDSREFELYQKKIRNRETDELPTQEETLLDYEKRAALRIGFTRIVTIGVGFVKSGKAYVKHIKGTEEEILSEFFAITNQFEYLAGNNILGYDLPVIYTSAIKYFDFTGMIKDSFNTSGKKPWELKNVIDLMDVFKGTHYANLSLDEVMFHFGLESSKGDIDGSQVSKVYYEEGLDRILEYVKKDVFANINIFLKMRFEDTFPDFTDRSDVKTEIVKKSPLQIIYESDYFSDAVKNDLRAILSKKKMTKKDKDFIREILSKVYIKTEFMDTDKPNVIEGKLAEIEEFIKTL